MTQSERAEFRLVVIVPVYNHGGTIARVLAEVRKALPGVGICVINDGSTDATKEAVEACARETEQVEVLTQAVNKGKGAALLRGFTEALQKGYTHALTIDADGQHALSDVPPMLEAARHYPDDLIIGERDFARAGNVPAASRKGAAFSRFWLHVQTGQDIPDSQCGMRIYPLGHVTAVPARFKRFDFETEILARLAWAGLTIRSVPIRCIYFPPEQRVSHYRPLRDTVRGVRVNVYLVVRRIMPVPFRRRVSRRETFARKFGPWWKWGTWRTAVRQMVATGASNNQLSAALAVGVFIGLTPTFPVQTVLTIYVATRLHLNVLAAFLGSHISFPLLMPLWVYVWLQMGTLLLHGHWMTGQMPAGTAWELVMRYFWIVLVGSMVTALAVSAGVLILARIVLGAVRRG